MTDTHLPEFPMQSHEEALPYLRRPYLASQVYAKIQSVPKNEHAPCTVVLYSIGETMMDRFNLFCGSDWTHEFETLTETKSPGQKPWWYCKVRATITALGKPEADIGDGYGPTQAAAEMNARAQAGKRAGRWHGPGQCLYASDEILMWRGGDGEDQLRIPKAGNDRFENPYFDQQGSGQKYCRGRYEKWLKRDGEAVYGEPLDHLAIAVAIQARPTVLAVSIPNGVRPESRAVAHAANGNDSTPTLTEAPAEAAAAEPNGSRSAVVAAPAVKEWPPMPDHPAPPAALEAAQQTGYGEPVARLLTNLARGEGEDAKFGDAQLQAVANWITVLGDLEVAEDVIVKAITHNATKKTSQERRQAKFVKWLSEKASGEADTKNQAPEPGAEAPGAQTDPQPAANGNGNSQLEAGRALAELRQAKTDHEYSDRTVTRIAALATGVGPKARVDWPKVPPETLTVLAELLRSAGSLAWKNDQLDQEVLKYHNSAQQTSAAGRFSAFADYLTDLAETRAMTQDNAVEVG
jgi:hypothetical protein